MKAYNFPKPCIIELTPELNKKIVESLYPKSILKRLMEWIKNINPKDAAE